MENDAVIIEHTYDAPVEKVWKAITDLRQMRAWYFPMLEDFKAEVGFETKFTVVAGGKDYLHIWKVVEVIPAKKISYEWKFGGYPGNSLLTFELFQNQGGTRLVLTHTGLKSFQGDVYPELAKENFMEGWTQFIGTALRDFLALGS